MVKTELLHREQTVNGGSCEDLKCCHWRGIDRENQSNSGKEISHLPKSNQPI